MGPALLIDERGPAMDALCQALLRQVAEHLVGRMGLKEAQLQLRRRMHEEALKRTQGSVRAAAALLSVDRRYVQLMTQRLDD